MSASLLYTPFRDDSSPVTLPRALKRHISRRLWDHDSSLSSPRTLIGKETVPFLEGLASARVEGAQDLIDAIHRHEFVHIWTDN